MSDPGKKKIRTIKVDLDKCNGCRACEIACAAFHATPKFSSFNPSRSRIRMVINERNDEWVAIRATNFSRAECSGRRKYTNKGKEYSECSFCGTICPARGLFKDPDSGLPLKCDMCGDDPEQIPMCVQICSRDALTYSEREEQSEEEIILPRGDVEIGLEALIDKHGLRRVLDTLARMRGRAEK